MRTQLFSNAVISRYFQVDNDLGSIQSTATRHVYETSVRVGYGEEFRPMGSVSAGFELAGAGGHKSPTSHKANEAGVQTEVVAIQYVLLSLAVDVCHLSA